MKATMIVTVIAAAMAFGLAARAEEVAKDEGKAVMCPKCETVWVKTPKQVGGKAWTYVSTKKMKCADCRNAVESFFATGELKHTCSTCGDLVMCEVHPEPTSGPAPSDSTFVPGKGHEKK